MPRLPLTFIPDPDEPDAIQVYVDASIADEPVRLLLDTGAGSCTVPTTQHTADLEVVEADTGMGASGLVGGDDVVIVPLIALGSREFHNVRATRIQPSPDRLLLLGMNVMAESRCHFRFTSELLELDAAWPPNIDLLPFTSQPHGQPMVPFQFGSVSAAACWDTGCSITAVDAAFVNAHPGLFEIGEHLEATDSGGHCVEGRKARMAGCTIGGVDFASSPCVILDFSPVNSRLDTRIDIGIGMPLLSQADWVFDFAEGVWAISRGPASQV